MPMQEENGEDSPVIAHQRPLIPQEKVDAVKRQLKEQLMVGIKTG